MTAAEDATARLEQSIPIAHRMGVRVIDVGSGHATAEVPLEGNTNHVGTMYAGVLFTVAELLGGLLAVATFDTSQYFPIVKDVRIHFLRPATSTIRATASLDAPTIAAATSAADADGKADYALRAELTDESGAVVATTEGTYQIRRR